MLYISCTSKTENITAPIIDKNNLALIPVTDYLKGQLKEIEESPVTPLKTTMEGGKMDSVWVSRDSIRTFAAPFLSPRIDSASLSAFFEGTSFLDQSVNAVTLTYEANAKIPTEVSLKHLDIYIHPEQNVITRVYMVKDSLIENGIQTLQLTWNSGNNCSIITIIQEKGKKPRIKEENMIWGFH